MTLLEKLRPKEIQAALSDLVSRGEWQVFLAVCEQQAKAQESRAVTSQDHHQMAVAVGAMNAFRQIQNVVEMYINLTQTKAAAGPDNKGVRSEHG